MEKTTRQLDKVLNDVKDVHTLKSYMDLVDSTSVYSSFSDYFFQLEKVKSISENELRTSCDIDRTYYYHIKDGSKNPGRNKVLRLCLAAHLDANETRRSLEAGGLQPLYAKSKRDAVIQYAINNNFTVIDTNLLLDEYDMEPL